MKVAVITASDKGSRGEREDLSGKVIKEMVEKIGGELEHYEIVPDDLDLLASRMLYYCYLGVDLILTTGGTGLGPRDNTPDATREVIKKEVPGITEAMRMKSFEITNRAILSRAVAGVRGKTLIINLPGSPKGVKECLEVIIGALPHGIEILRGEASECARK